jgi:hypothetical protein
MPTGSATYYCSDQDLQQIISKTEAAINEMNTVNNTVQSHTDSLVDANRSDSGHILSGHLTAWNSDFHACVNNLTNLNHKAQSLLQINRGTDANATGSAR